jgi:hypothetical protein
MPWTIPNLLLHDKPPPLSDQRASGYAHVFAYCLNPGCHHNGVLRRMEASLNKCD